MCRIIIWLILSNKEFNFYYSIEASQKGYVRNAKYVFVGNVIKKISANCSHGGNFSTSTADAIN